jgi:hypothetical protein
MLYLLRADSSLAPCVTDTDPQGVPMTLSLTARGQHLWRRGGPGSGNNEVARNRDLLKDCPGGELPSRSMVSALSSSLLSFLSSSLLRIVLPSCLLKFPPRAASLLHLQIHSICRNSAKISFNWRRREVATKKAVLLTMTDFCLRSRMGH